LASTYTDKKTDEELEQLKALVAEQQERLDALEGHGDASLKADSKEQRATRRQMLKLAGAALAGAAGSAALRAVPASAADGDPMTVGIVRDEQLANATGVRNTTAQFTPNIALFGYSYNDGIGVYAKSYYGAGVASYANGVQGTGLVAVGANAGVISTGGTGVTGVSNSGTGVKAQTNASSQNALFAYTAAAYSVAVRAQSVAAGAIIAYSGATTGVAPGITVQGRPGVFSFSSYSGMASVVAVGKTGGPDIKAAGSGRIVQVSNITGGVGAPNFTPAAGYFETVRAGDGAMWINRGTGTLKAAWKRLNAVRVDSSDGAGTPFKPKRVIDTRSGAIKAAGSTTKVTVAGVGAGTSNIPSDAVAVIGNLTAVNYTGSGFLAIMPAGVAFNPASDPSSVNFIVGQKAIANGFVVGLGTGADAGKVQVVVAGHASHFIIDITGYMQ